MMKKKGCTWKRQTKENVVSSSFILFQCIPCSPAWQFCTNNIIILAMQNVLLEFFQVSHCYCLPVGVPVVLLLSKSDTNYGRLHLYFLTHLQISSRADFWYSLCHKHLGNFAFDSDTNSVTNENPHLKLKSLPPQNRILIPFRILSLCHGQN